MNASSEPPQLAQDGQRHRWTARLRALRTRKELLVGLIVLSLLLCGLLLFGTTPQQQRSWPVADLILVTAAVYLVGALVVLVRGVATQRPWWTRILSTIGVVGLWLC